VRVALVASSFLPEPGRLERRVDRLARGLAQRGAEVEILTQGPGHPRLERCEGVTIRRFPTAAGPLRFAVSPKLRERLRLTSQAFDIVDVHTRQAPLAVAVAGARTRRLVLTPCASIDAFLGRSHTRATRALTAASPHIVCRSEIERDLLSRTIPGAARRARVVPDGIDVTALRAAEPFPVTGTVVLAVDRLDRGTGVGRAIAAIAGLDSEFRLVAIGDGPARRHLLGFAADLHVSSRVQLVGAVSDDVLHRWLRTARVVVALSEVRSSGSTVAEACVADVPIVASDLPAHRRAAEAVGGGSVIFITPKGSPLDVVDAIEEAARLPVISNPALRSSSAPSWESLVDATWDLYRQMLGESRQPGRDDDESEVLDLTGQLHVRQEVPAASALAAETQTAAGPAADDSWWQNRRRVAQRVNGARRWR
jgi:glycosyltransferase involved in cell wall biosynthesis